MARNRIEDASLEAYFEWLELKGWSANAFHVANESMVGGAYAATRKRKGVKAGIADIIIDVARHGYHGLRIEMKSPNGSLSLEQLVFLHNELNNGYLAVAAFGIDAAMRITGWYFQENDNRVPGEQCIAKRKGISFPYWRVI